MQSTTGLGCGAGKPMQCAYCLLVATVQSRKYRAVPAWRPDRLVLRTGSASSQTCCMTRAGVSKSTAAPAGCSTKAAPGEDTWSDSPSRTWGSATLRQTPPCSSCGRRSVPRTWGSIRSSTRRPLRWYSSSHPGTRWPD